MLAVRSQVADKLLTALPGRVRGRLTVVSAGFHFGTSDRRRFKIFCAMRGWSLSSQRQDVLRNELSLWTNGYSWRAERRVGTLSPDAGGEKSSKFCPMISSASRHDIAESMSSIVCGIRDIEDVRTSGPSISSFHCELALSGRARVIRCAG